MRVAPSRAGAAGRAALGLLGLLVGLGLLGAAGAGPAAGDPVSFNMGLVANLPLTSAADVSAAGNLAFVARENGGAYIIDVSQAASPVLLATWQHPVVETRVRDVRPLGNYLYVSDESGGPFGLHVVDISNPAAPALLTSIGPPDFPQYVHNLWAAGNHLYLSGYGQSGGNVIVNVSNPAAPVRDAVIPTDIHDNSVVGTTLYIAAGFGGLYLYNIANPASPTQLSHFTATTPDTSYYAHNAWPIDNRYVLLTEEVQIPPPGYGQASVRVVDFINPLAPVQVFRWRTENEKDNSNITPHNGYVVGIFAYVSYYQDGVRVLDVSDPTEPVEVAWYDTFPAAATTLFQGCWGVYPFQGNGRIFASDRSTGFFVLSFNGARKATLAGTVRDAMTFDPIGGAAVKSLTANRSVAAAGDGSYVLKMGSGTHDVRASAAGYHPSTESAVLADLGTTVHDFLLTPVSTAIEEGGAPGVRPLELALSAAPNPVAAGGAGNGRVGLRIGVSERLRGEALDLAIYGPNGAHIRTLASGRALAGTRVVVWDGRDAGGRRLGRGVVFARLQVGAGVETVKVVLGP